MNPPYYSNIPRSRVPSTARDKILAQWRGWDSVRAQATHARPGKRAGDVLPSVLKGMRFDRRQSEAEIVRVWNNIIDPVISAHAKPVSINKGTLFVSVDSSVWLDEIVRYRRREILERLQHSFGKDLITKISFRVG